MVQEAEESKTREEMTMNAIQTLYRNVTCAAVAAVICLVCSMAFVDSTARVPGAQPEVITVARAASVHWFGQPEPAVLVD